MEISKNIVSEYQIGILWNMASKYVREMMLRIAIMEDVIQVRIYDLKDKYAQFILDCYEGDKEAYEDDYIYEKIKSMNKENHKIIAFVFKIDNPVYRINNLGNLQCVQTRQIKKKIRDEYSNKINNYFFDNLIHISDNKDEMRKDVEVLNKYNSYIVREYLRKGYEPILKKEKGIEQNKTYNSLLNKLATFDKEID